MSIRQVWQSVKERKIQEGRLSKKDKFCGNGGAWRERDKPIFK
jgi:hypothetical protein